LEWLRHLDQNLQLNLCARTLVFSEYTEVGEGRYEERAIIGDLNQTHIHESAEVDPDFELALTFFERYLTPITKFDLYSFECGGDQEFTLQFKILRPSGEKNIYIRLNNLKLLVQPATLANIGLWSLLEQRCWPP
jgi:hypothetical protein